MRTPFQETDQHRNLCDVLYQALPEVRRAFVITIDGRTGAGKSTLARYLSCQLEMTALELDVFRDLSKTHIDFRLCDLGRAIEARTRRDRHVIVEGITVARVLRELSVEADFRIFVAYEGAEYGPPSQELQEYFLEHEPAQVADFTFFRGGAAG